ncbi:MAG: hypothetical protein FJY86_03755 [Candidatus Diapherotrites archaeon]|uniref:Thioredoxin-like fold domain-containing protein n=1 Tax=Candidatus Iainarchaeum sp. TaxID=3101447 RepID=A0A8T4CBB4_9ARCH|nr:hypothetical protein [Candidatus Diapherotrites archaeon]
MNTSENTLSTKEKHGHPPNNAPHVNEAHTHPHAANTHASPAKNTPARAWMIGAFVLVVVLLVGFLIFTKMQNTNTSPPAEKSVEVKLLVDASCEFCPKTNTILSKFDESKITYTLSTIDMHSEEGQKIIQDFEIEYVPTALVNVVGLDQNSTVQAALQGQFIKDPLKIRKGWIIVPEKFLDKQPKLLTFVKKPETCTLNEGKIKIDAQLDFGDCKPCINAHIILQQMLSKYTNVYVDYDPIMYGRTTLKSMGAALFANKGAVCAEELGYLNEYAECNYFNSQFHGNLDMNFMKACALDAGMSKNTINNEFVPCVSDINASPAEQTLINNTKTMHAWNPLKYTPSFVIDCTYAFVGQNSLERNLCSIHPELTGCAEVLEEARKPMVENTIPTDENTSISDTNAIISVADTNSI